MKDYLSKQDRYNKDFADGMVKELYKLKYGISNCYPEKDLDLLIMRKELVEWQLLLGTYTLPDCDSCNDSCS